MKTMYKGVLTVAAATLVASAAIMMAGGEVKNDTTQVGNDKTKPDQSIATATEKNNETVKGEVVADAVVVADKTAVAQVEEKQGAEVANAGSPPPPPGPFSVKQTVDVTTETVGKPTAPVQPLVMDAPKAPVAPTTPIATVSETAKTEVAKDTGSQAGSVTAEIKPVVLPVTEIQAPKAPTAPVSVSISSETEAQTSDIQKAVISTPKVVKDTDSPTDSVTAEIKPTAPVVDMQIPQAPVAPTAVSATTTEAKNATVNAPESVKETESKKEVLAVETKPTPPVVEMKTPQAPVAPTAVSVTTTEAKNAVVSAPESAQDTENKKEVLTMEAKPTAPVVEMTIPPVPVAPTAVSTTAKPETQVSDVQKAVVISAPKTALSMDRKTDVQEPASDVPEKIEALGKSQAPVLTAPNASTEMQAPEKPTINTLKAPEAPKIEGNTSKSVDSTKAVPVVNEKSQQPLARPPQPVMFQQNTQPQAGTNTTGGQQSIRMMPPQMMMPQGMRPQMIPPQMMRPQMMNGQRVIMVPVYPMNMGRPVYPHGQKIPTAASPQGQPPAKPNPQQSAPAENTGK